jgi:CPA2 family monovalent cation:H+ antiporter-2
MESPHGFPTDVLLILFAALIATALFRRVSLPPIIAYLIAGLLLGPPVTGWIEPTEQLLLLGEVGVALLLFTIGLQFSLGRLRTMRYTLFTLGGGQVLVGTLSGALIAWAWGVPLLAALIVGGALSLSSTAIVVKQLTDQGELATPHGHIALGVLLFQDLAAVPFIVLIPLFAQGEEQVLLPVLFALFKGLVALVVMLAVGRWLLRPLFHEVSAARFPELFTVTALLVSLTAAWLTAWMGLSLVLGAFLAGMMLGETEFRHQVEDDIRPLRDLLVGLYFMVVGMTMEPASIAANWLLVALLVVGMIIGKGGAVYLLARATGSTEHTALRAGLFLGHGGEFSVALLTMAIAAGLLSQPTGQGILAAVVVSMLLAPFMVRRAGWLVRRLVRTNRTGDQREISGADREIGPFVLVCGYGRTGKLITRVLDEIGIRYLALDKDPQNVKRAWEYGTPVSFGDAGSSGLLRAAGLDTARAVVLSFADDAAQRRAITATRRERPEVPILVRARNDEELDALIAAGATEGVPETLETALMLLFQLLVLLEIPAGHALEHIRGIRSDRYPLLKGFLQATATPGQARLNPHEQHLKTVIVERGAGKPLGEFDFMFHGVLIASLRRPGSGLLPPTPETLLHAGDILVLHGGTEDLRAVEEAL